MQTLFELNNFNHVTFHDSEHQYFIGDQELVSVTTVISMFKKAFDRDGNASRVAEKRGIPIVDILAEWDRKKDVSCEKGTCFHEFAELFLANKAYQYRAERLVEMFGSDTLEDIWPTLVGQFERFYQDSSRNLVPVRSEVVIGDAELGIGGMIDQIYFNKKSGMLEIWDWKTNKAISKKSNFRTRMLSPLDHLDECEWNTYSLQLALYKYVLEKNTGLRFGNNYLAWFNEKNENYKIFKCAPFSKEIKQMLQAYKQMVGKEAES